MKIIQELKNSLNSVLVASAWSVISLPLSIVFLFVGQSILTGGGDWCEFSYRNPTMSEVLIQFRDANFVNANQFLNIVSATFLIISIALLAFMIAKTHRSSRWLVFTLMLFPIVIFSLLWWYGYSSGLICQY